MSKKALASNRVIRKQTDCIGRIANAKGVSRQAFQKGIKLGTFGRVLDGLKNGYDLVLNFSIVRTIKIKTGLRQDWNEAINAGAPDTPSDSLIRTVADLYPNNAEAGEIEQELTLVNFPEHDGCWELAQIWAQLKGATNTVPREVFAIGEQHPDINDIFGQGLIRIVATTDCLFAKERRACHIRWLNSVRTARLSPIVCHGQTTDWFAFIMDPRIQNPSCEFRS